MKTSKSISTISYNSVEFLIERCEALRKAKKIEFWFAVQHKAEDDETKDHVHLWLQPACLLQTLDLQEAFIEVVPGDRPLGCINFNSSKVEDAFLYFLHDEKYLAAKGQSRKYHYSLSEVLSPDPLQLDYFAKKAYNWFAEQFGSFDRVKDLVNAGFSDEQIVLDMHFPLNATINAFKYVYAVRTTLNGMTWRNGREGHEKAPPQEEAP